MPKLLDLYCGAGGGAVGYHEAGFDKIVGVDKVTQRNYPFDFVLMDVFKYLETTDISEFDVIHASPPCQAYSATRHLTNVKHSDRLEELRDVLVEIGKPYVIENVVGAPLRRPIMLCGTMFPPLRVIRHRLFESNIKLVAPKHEEVHPAVVTRNTNRKAYGQLDEWKDFVSVTGGRHCSNAAARDAMGVDWYMTGYEVAQAIPPPYTKYIGEQLIAHLKGEGL